MTIFELFQSTLPRGERRRDSGLNRCHCYFNPRSREGSDCSGFQALPLIRYFNPRSREGSDSRNSFTISAHDRFQSTLPRGERPNFNPRSREGSDNFNPRSREGSDDKSEVIKEKHYDFNPRSREGSDALLCAAVLHIAISIHAPARGATNKPMYA